MRSESTDSVDNDSESDGEPVPREPSECKECSEPAVLGGDGVGVTFRLNDVDGDGIRSWGAPGYKWKRNKIKKKEKLIFEKDGKKTKKHILYADMRY